MTTNAKLKADAVKQEVEKHRELVTSLFRALLAISHIEHDSKVFMEYMAQEVKNGQYQEVWNSVIKEHSME